MPQTREHLAVLDLLGIQEGIVVISKIDRADPVRVQKVVAEVQALIADTVLADATVLPLSAHRGDGIDALSAVLDKAAATIGIRESKGRFRMAVDRTFTLAGIGLVATGTVYAGSVAAGDRLRVSPIGRDIRVRSLRAQNEAAERGTIGQRCALAISGPRVEKADVSRGAWILAPELDLPTCRADVRLRLLPTEAKALRHWTPVHIHIGAADISGRVALLEGASLAPGKSALARVLFDQPTSALQGDRFVLRDQSARRTIGGGRIIDPHPPLREARKPARLAFLQAFDTPDAGEALDELLMISPKGVDFDHFASVRNLDTARSQALLSTRDIEMAAIREVPTLFTRVAWATLRGDVLAAIAAYQDKHAHSFGATAAEILRSMPPQLRPALAAAINTLIDDKAVLRVGQLLHLPGHAIELTLDEENLWHEVAALLVARNNDPPRLALIAEGLRLEEDTVRPLLEKLARMGKLTRVSKTYFVLPHIVARLAVAGEGCAGAHEQAMLTVGHFREATAIGRNATMPVLEFFDRVGFTARYQDGRRIKVPAASIFATQLSP
jgi:selenocysteine-specific elongation factor